jgi:hypothetical protein
MSQEDMHLRILKKCGGDLEHAVKSRAPKNASTEDIINILEDIITRTRIGRKYQHKKSNTEEESQSYAKVECSITDTPKVDNPHKDKKCYNCQKIGHTSHKCPQKDSKIINQVDIREKPKNDQEQISDNEFGDGSSISSASN